MVKINLKKGDPILVFWKVFVIMGMKKSAQLDILNERSIAQRSSQNIYDMFDIVLSFYDFGKALSWA